MSQATMSCRVPGPLAAKLKRGAKEQDRLKAEIVRRALRYYVEENPEELASFREPTTAQEMVSGVPGDRRQGQVPEPGREEPAEEEAGGVYDPLEDDS